MSSNYPMTELSMVVLLSFGVATLFVTCAEGNNFDTCPLHWWSIPNERCVRVFPLRKTLKEAADICRLFESELLSAGQELDELQDYISPIATSVAVSQLLLGVTDPWGTGVFLWLDGSLFDDSVWADHYPKPSGGRCAVFRTEERDLVNVHCTGNNAFICQKSRGA
ncbi:snaclec 6-like [Haliotis rufescens]|uniref:snaclec 6-like n=1 Tax=Haliotis rufescens TaxID=6454 RepID=UPI00201E8CBE|nr:snaclec 6-like [Haliotis rufescens]